jgi:hypothetical protein
MKINELKTKVGEMTFEKIKMTFPIEHYGNGYFTNVDKALVFTISPRGAAYMNTRIRNTSKVSKETKDHFSYKSFVSYARNEMWDILESHMNSAYNELVSSGWKKDLYGLIINGELRGIVTKNFDYLPHELIIDQVIDNNLSDAVYNCNIDDEKMTIFLSTKRHKEREMSIFVRIENGHTGYNSLNYRVIAANDNYFFVVPNEFFVDDSNEENKAIEQKNRHLSKIGDTFNNLLLLLEKAGSFQLTQKLYEIEAGLTYAKIDSLVSKKTKRQIEIMSFVKNQINFGILKNGYDVINEITKHSLSKGYGNAVTGLVNPFMEVFIEEKFNRG